MNGDSLMSAQRICILKADRIGDIVLVSGYLKLLAERLPDAQIDLHLAPDMFGLRLLLHPRINVLSLPFPRHLDVADRDLASWLWDIDQENYDHLIVPRFTFGETDVLALRYLHIAARHGFGNFENPIPEDWLTLRLGPAQRDMDHCLEGPEVDPWSHEVEKYFALANWQGLQPQEQEVEPALYVDGNPLPGDHPRSGLLLWPGASDSCKRWPVRRFAELYTQLAESPSRLMVGGTPDEAEIVDALLGHLPEDAEAQRWICDVDDLAGTFRRIAGFESVIVNDTGIAHLAAAADCRVLSISSAVHDGRFLLRGSKSVTAVAEVPCRHCHGDCIFDEPLWPCVSEIQPEPLAEALAEEGGSGRLGLVARRFEEDPKSLLTQVAQHNVATTLARQREYAQLHYARMTADDLRHQAEAQAKELATEAEQHRTEAAEAESRAGLLEQHLEDLRARLSLDKEREQKLLSKLDGLSESISKATTVAERAGVERDELVSARRADIMRIEELQIQLEDMAQDKRALLREYEDLAAGKDQLAASINELQVTYEQTRQQREQLDRRLQLLHDDREQTVRRLRRLRRQLRESTNWGRAQLDTHYEPGPHRHTWLGPPAPGSSLPRISVVTPSYNTGPYIENTIASVLEQEYVNFEHIVVDSASADGTIDICARHPHLKWIVEKDRGQTHAINRGLMLSTGEIVAYLNSDDVYRPGAFHAVARYFNENPECMILVGDCDLIDEQGDTVGHWKANPGRWVDRVRYWGWEKTHCIPQQSMFMRRELLTRVGLFDADLQMVMDLDFWLRATHDYELGVIPETLAGFRLIEGTKTISRTHEMYLEQLQVCRRHARKLPFRSRIATAVGVRRHFARTMLKISEHYVFGAELRRLPLSLLARGVAQWPLLLLNPRTYLTAGQCFTRRSPFWPLVAQPHRAYLGVLWRLQNLGKQSD